MSRLGSKLCHQAIWAANLKGYKSFKKSLSSLKESQSLRLSQILENLSHTKLGAEKKYQSYSYYEAFSQEYPITNYSHWDSLIKEQMKNRTPLISTGTKLYQPTSGSHGDLKWIPYSKDLLQEFDHAAAPWIVDLYKKYPAVREGKHYWSLSWLPTKFRKTTASNDDLEVFSFGKRMIMAQTMAVDGGLSRAPTSDSALVATVTALASRNDLSFVSVWSPTFFLKIINELVEKKDIYAEILRTGKWTSFQEELKSFTCPKNIEAASIVHSLDQKNAEDVLKALWPKLALVSAWESSSSKTPADKIKKMLPHVAFQGKGLWATEGVVTIPFEGRHTLAVNSHFYEFECVDTGSILPSWTLEAEQIVRPIITTGGGLVRYALSDRLKVKSVAAEGLDLEFLGRLDGVDLVGEKMTHAMAENALATISKFASVTPVCLFALREHSRYVLLCEGNPKNISTDSLAQNVETVLMDSFHYRLARELKQLGPLQVTVRPDAFRFYEETCIQKGMILGNIKMEPVLEWKSEGLPC